MVMVTPDESLKPPSEDFFGWLTRIAVHADSIYVRHEGEDGRWHNAPLSELAPEQVLGYIQTWLERDQVPSRIVIKAPEIVDLR